MVYGGNFVYMAAENLLQNLYCFLEILQTSRSEEVLSWDGHSLDNALKWAAFAEQVNDGCAYMGVMGQTRRLLDQHGPTRDRMWSVPLSLWDTVTDNETVLER